MSDGEEANVVENENENQGGTEGVFDDFFQFVNDFKSLLGWLSAIASVPLVGLILDYGPPLPEGKTATFAIAVLQFCILMMCYEFWRKASSITRVKLYMLISLILAVSFLVLELVTTSMFVESIENRYLDDNEKGQVHILEYVVGSEFTEDAKAYMEDPDETVTNEDLIRDFDYDAEEIWTKNSLVKNAGSCLAMALLLGRYFCRSSRFHRNPSQTQEAKKGLATAFANIYSTEETHPCRPATGNGKLCPNRPDRQFVAYYIDSSLPTKIRLPNH